MPDLNMSVNPLIDEVIPWPRRTMVLFFLVDTSGSMVGSKIGTVNSAIEEVIPHLRDLSFNNADSQIKIAALEFSTEAKWITQVPTEAESFGGWLDLNAGGVTAFGAACAKLNEKLTITEKGFMIEVAGSYAPVILLLSDGGPTDNYKEELEKLKNNNWFKVAIKIAIAIGDDADKSVLEEFTGAPEAILEAHDEKTLKKMIVFVSVRASQIFSRASKSVSDENETESKKREFFDALNEFKVEAADSADTTNIIGW